MTLPKYIVKIGDVAFAKRFGVAVRTAAAYRLRERMPRPDRALKILAGSHLTWLDIYGRGDPLPLPRGPKPRKRAS